jgi:hypothetical protein
MPGEKRGMKDYLGGAAVAAALALGGAGAGSA